MITRPRSHRALPPTTPLRMPVGHLPVPGPLLAAGGAGLAGVVLAGALVVAAVVAVAWMAAVPVVVWVVR